MVNNTGFTRDITWLAEKTIDMYIRNRFVLVIIHGEARLGKSTYAAISAAQAYGIVKIIENEINILINNNELNPDKKMDVLRKKIELFNQFKKENKEFKYDWESVKKYFVFKPRDFLRISKPIGKKPMCIVDDAGRWLNAKEHANAFVRGVTSSFEIIGTRWACLVLTCKNKRQLVALAREDPKVFTIRVEDIGDYQGRGFHPQIRLAFIYKGWETEDMKRSGKKAIDISKFVAWMPDAFFQWYEPIRDSLCTQSISATEKHLDQLISEGREEYKDF